MQYLDEHKITPINQSVNIDSPSVVRGLRYFSTFFKRVKLKILTTSREVSG